MNNTNDNSYEILTKYSSIIESILISTHIP